MVCREEESGKTFVELVLPGTERAGEKVTNRQGWIHGSGIASSVLRCSVLNPSANLGW